MKQKTLFSKEDENEAFSPKLDKWLYQVEEFYQEKLNVDEWYVYRKWGDVERFFLDREFLDRELTMGNIRRLLQFGTRFRDIRGSGRNRIEEHFFKLLCSLIWPHHTQIPVEEPPFPIDRNEIDSITKKKSKLKSKLEIFLEIEKFAVDSYHYKRERDSFGGSRRAFSLNVLMDILSYFKDSEGPELAKKSLKSKSRVELHAAFDFLKRYYISRELDVEEDVNEQLIKISEKTRYRDIAVGALSVLVDTNMIDEFEALYKIDEWKEKNYYS
jgi:hypothetical protein